MKTETEKPKCPKCGSIKIRDSAMFEEYLWCRLCDEYFSKPKTIGPCQMERRVGALDGIASAAEEMKEYLINNSVASDIINEAIVAINCVLEEFEEFWR